jgi:hypothetical protein
MTPTRPFDPDSARLGHDPDSAMTPTRPRSDRWVQGPREPGSPRAEQPPEASDPDAGGNPRAGGRIKKRTPSQRPRRSLRWMSWCAPRSLCNHTQLHCERPAGGGNAGRRLVMLPSRARGIHPLSAPSLFSTPFFIPLLPPSPFSTRPLFRPDPPDRLPAPLISHLRHGDR